MWPFKRKQTNQPAIPTEVKDYYQAERRERVGIAWLLALATLVATVVLAFGLFFGGRWVYRKINKHSPKTPVAINNKPAQPAQTPTSGKNQGSASQPSSGSSTSGASKGTSSVTTTTPSNESGGQSSTDSENAATNQNTSSPATAPVQNNKSGQLTNTGPGNTVAIFLGTSALAALGHYQLTKRKISAKG